MPTELRAPNGRIVISVPTTKKQSHRFSDGTTIYLARGENNFNLREWHPVNGIVIASNQVPIGTEILFQYNAIQDTFRVYNYKSLSGSDIASDIHYYSIPEEMGYAYLDRSEWKPLKGYVFGLRVFRPYKGILTGIEPTKIKDTLYITTGDLKGLVVRTLKASDYQIVFQDTNGQEGNIICVQHYEDENDKELVIMIDHDLTEGVQKGDIHVGLTKSDAKPIFEYA